MSMEQRKAVSLADFLARAGFGGHREAKRLIAAGRVQLNGQPATRPDCEIIPRRDHVRVNGKLIKKLWPLTYILMNKPLNTITAAFDPRQRKTVYDLLGKYAKVVQSVGRLDYDTEGALLFTNDGELAHALTDPRSHVTKVYRVKVKGHPSFEALARLRAGVDIGGYRTAPAKVRTVQKGPANTWLRLTLTEGKYRQVKRMVAAVGHPVLSLIRERFGPLAADRLKAGQWRHLEEWEVRQLKEATNT